MDKIIENLTEIVNGDPGKVRGRLRDYIEVLKEARDKKIAEMKDK
jgi:hypothetical protein